MSHISHAGQTMRPMPRTISLHILSWNLQCECSWMVRTTTWRLFQEDRCPLGYDCSLWACCAALTTQVTSQALAFVRSRSRVRKHGSLLKRKMQIWQFCTACTCNSVPLTRCRLSGYARLKLRYRLKLDLRGFG